MKATFWIIINECSVAQGINGQKLIILDGSGAEAEQGYIDASVAIRVGAGEPEGALIERNGSLMLSATRWVSDAEYAEIAQRIIAVKAGNGTVSVWLNVESETVEMDGNGTPRVYGISSFSLKEGDIIYQFLDQKT